jgi:predicted metalloprotease with PDZ domain
MEHVFVLYDRATQSVWYPGEDQTLQAVGGPRKGTSIPFLDEPAPVTLAAWLEQHPNTEVLLPSEAEYESWQRARLGVGIERAENGIRISRVADDSAAAAAGLLAGDVMLRISGKPVTNRDDLRGVLSDYRAGDSVKIDIERLAEGADTVEALTVSVTFTTEP